jgi:hypothetical protein
MAKHERPGNSASEANDSIAELVRLAGPRPDVPPDVERRVHEAVRAEWRNAVRRRRTLWWSAPIALAATIILGIALSGRDEVRVAPVATVTLVNGDARTTGVLAPGHVIYPGDAIAVGDFGIALKASNGILLRLDAGTDATLESSEELILRSGRIYADSGQSIRDNRSLTIRTSVGSATDIGTLFAVAYSDDGMTVAVREGRVDVSGNEGTYSTAAGDSLTLTPDNDVVFGKVPPYDSSWEWAEALAPSFDIENRTLLTFLQWAGRETGKELVFVNENARIGAMVTRLHGSVSDFTPTEAVQSVLPTTRFAYRIEEHRIVIGSASK